MRRSLAQLAWQVTLRTECASRVSASSVYPAMAASLGLVGNSVSSSTSHAASMGSMRTAAFAAAGPALAAATTAGAGAGVRLFSSQQQQPLPQRGSGCHSPNLAEVLYDSHLPQESKTEQLLKLLEDATPEELTSGATAAAILEYDDERFLGQMSSRLQDVIQDLSPNQLTAISVAFARLHHFDTAFKDRLADQVVLKIHQFEGPSLGRLVRSFGAMEYYDSDLLDAVGDHLTENVDKFDPEDIANVVYAFSRVGKLHHEFLRAVDEYLAPQLKEGKVPPHAMVSLVEGYSRLGCHWSDLVALVAEVAEKQPDLFDPAVLPQLVSAFARVGHCDSDTYNALAGPIFANLDNYTPKDITRVACAFGDAACLRPDVFDRIADDIVPSRITEFTANGLVNILRSLGKAGYYNNKLSDLVFSVVKDTPYLMPEDAEYQSVA